MSADISAHYLLMSHGQEGHRIKAAQERQADRHTVDNTKSKHHVAVIRLGAYAVQQPQ
jgi:hypothetical protein